MSNPVRDAVLFLRGQINTRLSQALNARDRTPRVVPPPLAEVIGGERSPLALSRLLEGRANAERQAAVAGYLEARGVPFARHPFESSEGSGENFTVELGSGRRVLLLIAHHDAVPGSPGANDNAAAVGILLALMERLAPSVPPGLRVRLLFTAAEERGYLGARKYARGANLAELAGVLSLELCGIGDTLALWDAVDQTPFLGRLRAAFEGIGLRRDEGYHIAGRIPLFGSDHRAFAPAGVPSYALTVVPAAQAEALRQFIFNPARSALRFLVKRPVPFDTYHTSRDRGSTLEPAAMTLTLKALEAVVAEVA
jgi:Peptidase family M28